MCSYYCWKKNKVNSPVWEFLFGLHKYGVSDTPVCMKSRSSVIFVQLWLQTYIQKQCQGSIWLIELLFNFLKNVNRYSDNIVTVNYFGYNINVLEFWYHDGPIWNNVHQWIIHNKIRNMHYENKLHFDFTLPLVCWQKKKKTWQNMIAKTTDSNRLIMETSLVLIERSLARRAVTNSSG